MRRRLSYANVIATLALFFALTGASIAGVKYIATTDPIPATSDLAGTYGSPQIGAAKVTSTKIADGAITSSKFDSSALAPNADKLDGLDSTAFAQAGTAYTKAQSDGRFGRTSSGSAFLTPGHTSPKLLPAGSPVNIAVQCDDTNEILIYNDSPNTQNTWISHSGNTGVSGGLANTVFVQNLPVSEIGGIPGVNTVGAPLVQILAISDNGQTDSITIYDDISTEPGFEHCTVGVYDVHTG